MGKGHVIRDRYEATFKGYDELYRAEQFEKYAVTLKKVRPRGRILDAGCGTGLLLEYMRATGFIDYIDEYVCLDYSWGMLSIARWRAQMICPDKCLLVGGNIESLPFSDKSFEVTYAFTVLDLVDSIMKALDELRRVTRGSVVVTMLKTLSYKDLLISKGYSVLAVSRKDVIFVV
ncbi:MAG: methyltransferase domain-containing protein [Desulfurococcales archaeon]|nr:methyltransferase domain-containing protein [Desulfurococcales archaeon]